MHIPRMANSNTNINRLFHDADVVGTSAIADAFGLSEAYVRAAGDEIGVSRVGNAQAWVEADVEELEQMLEEEAESEEEEESEDDDSEDPDLDEEDLDEDE